MGRNWMDYSAAGALAFGLLFAVLALNVGWGEMGNGMVTYGASEADFSALGQELRQSYWSNSVDDEDGVGLARTGGTLLLVGTLLLAGATLALENFLLTTLGWLRGIGAALAGLGTVAFIVGLILTPLGIRAFADAGNGQDITWIFGLYAGIFAGLGALVGTVFVAISFLRSTDFKLELAEPSEATFD